MNPKTKALYPKNWKLISLTIKGERNYECEGCGQYGNRFNNPLTVHHIDFNPQNNASENLLLLCARCHLKVQAKHYPSRLLRKYGQLALF